jgi:hypothetical protein
LALALKTKKNPVRRGRLTGSVGGGNEGKEETSFRFDNKCICKPNATNQDRCQRRAPGLIRNKKEVLNQFVVNEQD